MTCPSVPACMFPRAWETVGPGGLGSIQGLCSSLECGLHLGGLSSGWLLCPLCQQGGDSRCLRKSMLQGEVLGEGAQMEECSAC